MMYLTKIAYGRWWLYLDTRRRWRTRKYKILGRYLMVLSYRKVSDD